FEGGGVKCWGNAENGRLGYGNGVEGTLAADDEPFVNLGREVTASVVAAGGRSSCVILAGEAEGMVKCWGYGGDGATGYATTEDVGVTDEPADRDFVDIGGQATGISLGESHACAVLTDGDLTCWGSGADGRLGYGNIKTIGENEPPYLAGKVNLGGIKVAAVACGGAHTCAILMDGSLVCWGRGQEGQLGLGN
ncbi:unnamed protein product, partial [Chrysoparadoxa australica]